MLFGCFWVYIDLNSVKNDQSDLVNSLQQQWEEAKQEAMRLNDKIRLQGSQIDELTAHQLALEEELNEKENEISSLNAASAIARRNDASEPTLTKTGNDDIPTQGGPSKNTDSSISELLNEYETKLRRMEQDKASQEFVIQQLLEQQKQFQKRHKNLVAKMKQYKAEAKSQGTVLAEDIGEENNKNNKNNSGGSENVKIVIDFQQMYFDYYNNAQKMIDNEDILKFVEICLKDIQNENRNANGNNYESKEDFDELDENLNDLNINSKMGMLQIIQQLLKLRNESESKIKVKDKEIAKIVESHEKEVKEEIKKQETLKEDKLKLKSEIEQLQLQIRSYHEQIRKYEETHNKY